MPGLRRFPPAWTAEETAACFIETCQMASNYGWAARLRAGGTIMGKNLLAWVLAAPALLGVIVGAEAEQLGTAAQAKAMIERAIESLKANEANALPHLTQE